MRSISIFVSFFFIFLASPSWGNDLFEIYDSADNFIGKAYWKPAQVAHDRGYSFLRFEDRRHSLQILTTEEDPENSRTKLTYYGAEGEQIAYALYQKNLQEILVNQKLVIVKNSDSHYILYDQDKGFFPEHPIFFLEHPSVEHPCTLHFSYETILETQGNISQETILQFGTRCAYTLSLRDREIQWLNDKIRPSLTDSHVKHRLETIGLFSFEGTTYGISFKDIFESDARKCEATVLKCEPSQKKPLPRRLLRQSSDLLNHYLRRSN